jgi:hypothetical protein
MNDDTVLTSLREYKDRIDRIRAALWVNASVAIEKLEHSSRFWEMAPKFLSFHPKKILCTSPGDSLLRLEKLTRDIEKPFFDSIQKFNEFSATVKLLGPDSDQITDEEDEDEEDEKDEEDDLGLMRAILTNKIDNHIEEIDDILFGGLLSAHEPEKQSRICAKHFSVFASIDWVECIPSAGHEETLNRISYSLFILVIVTTNGRHRGLETLHRGRAHQWRIRRAQRC